MGRKVTLLGRIIQSSKKAVLFQDHFWHMSEWLPRSQLTIKEFIGYDEYLLKLSSWIADKKNIHEFEERKNDRE